MRRIPPESSLGCHVMSCCAMSCHLMSCHVTSCHAMSCHVKSCHVMSCHVMSCRVMSCHVMSCHVMSCHVMPGHAMSKHVVPCQVTSSQVKTNHVMTCHLMSWHAMSGHNITYQVMSCNVIVTCGWTCAAHANNAPHRNSHAGLGQLADETACFWRPPPSNLDNQSGPTFPTSSWYLTSLLPASTGDGTSQTNMRNKITSKHVGAPSSHAARGFITSSQTLQNPSTRGFLTPSCVVPEFEQSDHLPTMSLARTWLFASWGQAEETFLPSQHTSHHVCQISGMSLPAFISACSSSPLKPSTHFHIPSHARGCRRNVELKTKHTSGKAHICTASRVKRTPRSIASPMVGFDNASDSKGLLRGNENQINLTRKREGAVNSHEGEQLNPKSMLTNKRPPKKNQHQTIKNEDTHTRTRRPPFSHTHSLTCPSPPPPSPAGRSSPHEVKM